MEPEKIAENCKQGKNVYVVNAQFGKLHDASLINLARGSFCAKCSDAAVCLQEGEVQRNASRRATRVRLKRCLKKSE